MPRLRATAEVALSIVLSTSLIATPVWGKSGLGSGTVVYADRANVGGVRASAGTTVFVGDKFDTEQVGSLQIRAGAARLLLSGSSRLIWGGDADAPSATLTTGTAGFSTANANAFVLHAGTAAFKPQSDEPTVANVTMLSPKELLVRCSRGALLVAVEEDVRLIPEGSAYRIVLDPDAAPRPGEVPAPPTRASWGHNQPIKAGKSKFVWYAIALTALITWFAVWKAWESPDRP